jgi:hypothetical protein
MIGSMEGWKGENKIFINYNLKYNKNKKKLYIKISFIITLPPFHTSK